MNCATLPFVKYLFAVMISASAVAFASEAALPAKPNIEKGEALFSNGNSASSIPACTSCHGAGGNSELAQNPKLAGQHSAYTLKQLVDFKGPERNQSIMSIFANAMTADEMKNVAGYLNAQTQKAGAAKNKDIVEFGKKIYRAGIAEKNVPACAGCHGATGSGIPTQYPRIAGQHQDYTVAQLVTFRSGVRKNSAQMATITKRMSDNEMQAVADYVAGLK